MRLATIVLAGRARPAVVVQTAVFPLPEGEGWPVVLEAIVADADRWFQQLRRFAAAADAGLPLADVHSTTHRPARQDRGHQPELR